MSTLFRKKSFEKKKKSSNAPDPNAHIKVAKEKALREKVEEAQRMAAVEKVKMLNEKDKYEMLIGRKELAARYHKYLNKQLKERRILYVMINVDGTPGGPDVGSEWEEPSPTEPVTTKIRVKIKSGQDADFIAANLIDRYGLAVVHLPTIRETISDAIAKHEADNKLYEAEVSKVGMLIASNDGVDSDEENDDDEEVVQDEYLLMKKRLVKARRLAKDYEQQRHKIESDLAQHDAAPKIAYDGGEPSEAMIKELLFERDRYASIKHQLITSRERVMASQKERRRLDIYKQKLLSKIAEANRAASGEISVAAFWADYSHDNNDNNEKILLGNSDDDDDDDSDVSDEDHYHKPKKSPSVKVAEEVLSNSMKGMSNFLSKSATSFRDTIGDEQEILENLNNQLGATDDLLTSGIDDMFGGVSVFRQENKANSQDNDQQQGQQDQDKQNEAKEEDDDEDESVQIKYNETGSEYQHQQLSGDSTVSSIGKNNIQNKENKDDDDDDNTTLSSSQKQQRSRLATSSASISVDQLPEQHRPSIFESMFAAIGGPGSASKLGPENVLPEEKCDLPSPNQMAGFLQGIETPRSY